MSANPRPKGPLPTWATDDTYTSGPATGDPTKVEPLTGEKAQGWQPGQRLPAEKFNAIENGQDAWIGYLADGPMVDWHPFVLTDLSGATMPLTYVRGDGTTKPFWSQSLSVWVVPGSNNAGDFYLGDGSIFQATNTGGAIKWSFGCDTKATPGFSNILLFDHSLHGAGVAPAYVRSTGAFAGWTAGTLVSGGTVAASSQCNDVAVAASGRIIAVGQRDSTHRAWTSDDHGATWAEHTVAASAGTLGLQRIFVGKNNRLFAWINNTTVNGGNKLYYSDDEGTTWLARTLAFDSIRDGVYLSASDSYAFSSSGNIQCVGDPVSGTFVAYVAGARVAALGSNEGAIIYCLELVASIDYRTYLSRTNPPASEIRLVHRAVPLSAPLIPWAFVYSPEGQFGEFGSLYMRFSRRT
jgi:hypothetical protein